MEKIEFLYLQTLQHTGTWFVSAFVLAHEEVGGMITENDEFFVNIRGEGKLGRVPQGGGERIINRIVPGKKLLLHGHIAYHVNFPSMRLCPRQIAGALSSVRPLVVPLRDPLLAMITHKKRIPEADFLRTFLGRRIDLWQTYFDFLQLYDKYRGDAAYFPVDLLEVHKDRRLPGLKKLQAAYGLAEAGLAESWAKTWSLFNSYVPKSDEAKQMYAKGDLDWFEKHMGPSMAALRGLETPLRPILEREGYKDLLWWS